MQPIVAIFVVLLGVFTEYAIERFRLSVDALRPLFQRDSNTYEATKIELLEESNNSTEPMLNDAPSHIGKTNLFGAKYKTKKGVSQRVMDLQSLLPTSGTYSEATLRDANIPKLFEPN